MDETLESPEMAPKEKGTFIFVFVFKLSGKYTERYEGA
jgi:hypothetical protein